MKIIIFIIFTVCSLTTIIAQGFEVNKVDLNLPQENPIVKDISVDSKKLLWFIANSTLYRFDGFRSIDVLKDFKSQDLQIVPDKILVTANDKIILTSFQDIFEFDLSTWKLKKIPHNFFKNDKANNCTQIKELEDGSLLFLYDTGEILLYKNQQWKFINTLLVESKKTSQVISANFSLEEDQFIWIATSVGSLLKIKKSDTSQTSLISLFNLAVSIEYLIKVNQGFLVEAEKQGVYFFNGKKVQESSISLDKNLFSDIHIITENKTDFFILNKNKIVRISKENNSLIFEQSFLDWQNANLSKAITIDGHIVFASSKGVFILKPQQNVFTLLHNKENRTSVRSMYVFEDGALWYASYGGAVYIDKHKKVYTFQEFTNAYSVLPINKTQILIGCEGDFLKVFDQTTEAIAAFELSKEEEAKLSKEDKFVISLAMDQHYYYIGTYNGLWKLNKQTKTLAKYADIKGEDPTLGLHIRHITVQDSLNLQWSSSQGYSEVANGMVVNQYPKDQKLGIYKHIYK
jgi:ligand-binding sensor domain-containing protein